MRKIQLAFLACSILCVTVTAFADDRALIVGIERYADSTIKPSLGSEQDANDVERFLRDKLGFSQGSIKKMTNGDATSQQIKNLFESWLIEGTRAGDRVFFYYSGHGSYLPDDDKDETEDGYDETIVPYDTVRRRERMIRDDQFSLWITQLIGRRVVMIFDSCHSGTISRGIDSPGAGDATSRYIVPDQSELDKGPRMRDLIEVKVSDGKIGDGNSISRQSDILVLSASGARQTAHSMKDGGRWRGALTRAFVESYSAGTPALLDLREGLNAKIRNWQRQKLLKGEQIPECEVSSKRLNHEPLFGLWERVPEIAFINPNTKMAVTLQVDDKGKRPNADGHLVYYHQENISYRITTNTNGYLYLMAFSQNEQTGERCVSLLFPNKLEGLDNLIAPPGIRLPEKSGYEITPTGLDITIALVTSKKLLEEKEIKDKYSWEEIFKLINLSELQKEVYERTRGVNVTQRKFDWQAASLPIMTKERK